MSQDVLGALTYSTNWVMIFRQESYFETFGRPPLLRHLWSLAVEEQFYLIWPLVFAGGMALLARGRRGTAGVIGRFSAIVLVVVAASTALMWVMFVPFEDPSRVYFGTDTRAAGILLGVALAFVWQPWRFNGSLPRRGVSAMNVAGFTALGFLTLILATMNEFDTLLYRGGFLVTSILTCIAIAVTVHPQGALNGVLGIKPLVWVGKRSYGLYLYHWPIFMLLRPGVDVTWPNWITITVQFALTFAVAEVSYRWIEQPIRHRGFKNWLAWVLGPLHRRSPQAAAAWPVVAAVFVLGLTIGLVRGGSAPPLAEAVAASPENAPEASEVVDPGQPAGAIVVTTTAAPEPEEAAAAGNESTSTSVLLVGDSVMLGAKVGLENELGEDALVDGTVSRQMKHAARTFDELQAAGHAPAVAVIHLGTNGPFHSDSFDAAMEALDGVERVYFVNSAVPRRYEGDVNRAISQGVERWDRAHLIDWHSVADGRSDLFVSDGVHLTTAGIKAYAALIDRAVNG
jgi:peptidoglycan/LPS O-acetylase OafA/YrhL